jgi:hypothetical protein
MNNLVPLFKSLNKNKGGKYILYQFILIFLFATLYWLSDQFIVHFPELSKKLDLGSIKLADSFYAYLYFSFITQTTVGFGGILPDGGNVVDTNSELIKIFNICQMASIIFISGWTLI